MKKNLVLVVALIALIGVSAFAQDAESDFQVKKSADGKSVTISRYVGKNTTVNIPSKIQNLPVTNIGAEAFLNQGRIINVTIPEGVIIIEDGAFQSCSALETIIIPSSVTEIRTSAFNTCNMLKSVTFKGNNSRGVAVNVGFYGDLREKYSAGGTGTYTKSGNVWTKQGATTAATQSGDPESDFRIEKDGNEITILMYTGNKKVVNIPSKIQNAPVTQIGSMSFGNLAEITSVTIPNGVVSIGSQAFRNCTGLTSLTLPDIRKIARLS